MPLGIGICAFALFFLGDYNDWKLSRRALCLCFPAGMLCLAGATVWEAVRREAPLTGVPRGLAAALAILFAGLLAHTLFFALSAKASYTEPGTRRTVCTDGVYALCRHPGVIWLAGLYLCLWAAAGVPLWQAGVYSALNVLLVLFEDRCVFPAKLSGYGSYQHTTPFLLPNAQSVRRCLKKNKDGGDAYALR